MLIPTDAVYELSDGHLQEKFIASSHLVPNDCVESVLQVLRNVLGERLWKCANLQKVPPYEQQIIQKLVKEAFALIAQSMILEGRPYWTN